MCSYNRSPGHLGLVATGQQKKKIAEKPNGGNPDYLKMTSFAEIVRVADRQKISDALQKY